ncbi:hypothetical protein Pelo_16978 [Pelomyxa schiedti]|nr:hypothetical protein Pelo_16978 [Pelomyxa schiedti]
MKRRHNQQRSINAEHVTPTRAQSHVIINCFVVGKSGSDEDLFALLLHYYKVAVCPNPQTLSGDQSAVSLPMSLTITTDFHAPQQQQQYLRGCDNSVVVGGGGGGGYENDPAVDLVFHRNGSPTMGPGCTKEKGSVVLVVMPFRGKCPEKLSVPWDHKCSSYFGEENIILANFCPNQPVIDHDCLDYTLLNLAIEMRAGYLFKSKRKPSKDTITKLIDAIVLTSQTSGFHQDFLPNKCMRTSSSLFLPLFPREGLIGVTNMSCLHVRSLLHILDHRSNVCERLLRFWFEAGNWPAVDELVFSNFLFESELPLCDPWLISPLEGSYCRGVVLHSKIVQSHGIPEWVLRARIGEKVDFHPEQPTFLPKSSKPPDWALIKLSLLFGDEVITEEAPNRIVLVGGPLPHKAALLKCLMQNKTKATVKTSSTKTLASPPVIQVHKPFKLWNSLKLPLPDLCSAWELGGGDTGEDWNPFHPCFFFSDSVFMLVFDASSSSPLAATAAGMTKTGNTQQEHPAIPKLDFWMNQINSCQKNKMNPSCYRPHSQKPKVIFVGICTSNSMDEKLFMTIEKHCHLFHFKVLGRFTINTESGEGFYWKSYMSMLFESRRSGRPYSTCVPKANIIRSIAKAIERNQSQYIIPQRWCRFRAHLGTVKASAVKWSQLARIAHDCGVGRYTSKVSQAAEEEEMRLCFDWLSDIGAIFHFVHDEVFQSSLRRRLGADEIVVLDPSWFNYTKQLLPVEISPLLLPSGESESPLESLQRHTINYLHHNQIGTEVAGALSKLGVLVNSINNQPHFPFFMLPSVPSDISSLCDQFCKLCDHEIATNATGFLLHFQLLPVESFSKVVCQLFNNIPGVHPILISRDGILISKRIQQQDTTTSSAVDRPCEAHLMMILTADPATQNAVVVVAMGVVGLGRRKLMIGDNLLVAAVVVPAHHSFVCPTCLLQYLQINTSNRVESTCPLKSNNQGSRRVDKRAPSLPPTVESDLKFRNYNTLKQTMEATHGEWLTATLKCHRAAIQNIASSTDYYFFFYPVFNLTDEEASSATITRTEWLGLENTGPLTVKPFALQSSTSSLWENSILEYREKHTTVPDHPNIVKFIGVGVHGEMLLGLTEYIPPPPLSLLHHSLPLSTNPDATNTFSLSDLLKACLLNPQSQQQEETVLEQILPMCLREKILRDVAEGLTHLHSQFPPVAHGDVDIGTVLITSLDPVGSGPWAKLTHPMVTVDKTTIPSKSTQENQSSTTTTTTNSRSFSPEAIIQQRDALDPPIALDKTKIDVWNFGILVHTVVAPLSLVYLQSTSSSLPVSFGRFHWKLNEEGKRKNTKNTLLSTGSHPHPKQVEPKTRPVERHLVGYALASGTLVVGFQEGTGMMMNSGTRRGDVHQQPFAPWAQQLVTMCLVAEPTNRPTVKQLLVVWNYLSMEPNHS